MLRTPAHRPKQVLLRLPDELATRLARAVAPRQRNQFLVDLVRQALDLEDAQLQAACTYMNRIEAANPALAREGAEWVGSALTPAVEHSDPDFDLVTFEREFGAAQAALEAPTARAESRR